MKILINGYTVTEQLKIKRNEKDIKLAERMIDHIKINKTMYAKLVIITALMLHLNINIFAGGFDDSLDIVGNQIIDMLLSVAKWGCIGMGIKNMITTILNGGNMRHATTEGVQYFIGYLFIQFYPQLFELFGKITFK